MPTEQTAMQPVRIQRSRKEKQVSPNGLPIVYVGRPGRWGNPFKLSDGYTAEYAVHLFEQMMINPTSYDAGKGIYEKFIYMRDRIKDLQEKNLSCWCNVGESCHADVLLRLCNE